MPLPRHVEPIARPLARESAYAALRDWIVNGVLHPGEQVRDNELALRLGVSRTPVREALQRLEDEGLVITARNRWTRISSLRLDDARRLYPIVWTLEALAVRSAGARCTSRDLDEMAAANARLARALEAGDPVAASAADNAFHRVVIARAGNIELDRLVADLKLKLRRIEVAYFSGTVVARRSVLEHRRIIAALRRGAAEAAAAGIETNWRSALGRLVAAGRVNRDRRAAAAQGNGSPLNSHRRFAPSHRRMEPRRA